MFWKRLFLSVGIGILSASVKAQSFQDLLNEFSHDVDSIEEEHEGTPPSKEATKIQEMPEDEDEFSSGKMREVGGITLQGLDKQAARVYIIDVPIGKVVEFGTLRILVNRCLQSSPEDQPESKAFLVISENKTNASSQVLFSGWMFASSPAISALDHPVYDVWVKSCKAVGSQVPQE